MKKYDEDNSAFVKKSNKQKKSFMSDFYENIEKYEKEDFIVPWQLSQKKNFEP